MKKQDFLALFEDKLSNDEIGVRTKEMLSAYFDVLTGRDLSDGEILSLCDPERFEIERQCPARQCPELAALAKPYYDFSINSLSSDTYGPYDARYFKVHIVRSGRLTFREIVSESQIVFQVSTSGPISLTERTKAGDTFTLDVSTTAGLDVAALWAKNLHVDIYTGKVSLTFPEVLPLVRYPDNPLFKINLHNFGQLSIKFARGQKVCVCEGGSVQLDCRVERVHNVSGGDPYLYVSGGACSRLWLSD